MITVKLAKNALTTLFIIALMIIIALSTHFALSKKGTVSDQQITSDMYIKDFDGISNYNPEEGFFLIDKEGFHRVIIYIDPVTGNFLTTEKGVDRLFIHPVEHLPDGETVRMSNAKKAIAFLGKYIE